MGGVIWAYMGPRDQTPAPPGLRVDAGAGDASAHVSQGLARSATGCRRSKAASTLRTRRSCTARSPTNTSRPGIPVQGPFVRGKAPILEVDVTDYGYRYIGDPRRSTKTRQYVRGYHFVMPFTQLRPQQLGRAVAAPSAPMSPATSGCRLTTTTAWCGTGMYATATSCSSEERLAWNAAAATAPAMSSSRTSSARSATGATTG